MASLLCARVTALVVLLVLTFIFGTLPVIGLHFRKTRKHHQKRIASKEEKSNALFSANCYVQVLTQIGGGVLFYAVLVHMLPEIKQNYETYLQSNNSVFNANKSDDLNEYESNADKTETPSLPLVEILLCCGFFLVFLIEELMHWAFRSHSHQLSRVDKLNINEVSKLVSSKQATVNFGTFERRMTNETTPESSESQCSTCAHTDSLRTEIDDIPHRKCKHNYLDISRYIRKLINYLLNFSELFLFPVMSASISSNSYCGEIESLNHVNTEEVPLLIRIFDGIVIILAFSVHSLFDGISIGIQTSVSEVWTMFIAIASHKLLIAFILSVELYEKCGNFLLMSFYMLLFSIMSPIGIFIVIIMEQSISDSNGESSLAVISVSAIAAGTILYIVFFELLQKDRAKNLTGIVRFISMAFGFALMFAVSRTFQR